MSMTEPVVVPFKPPMIVEIALIVPSTYFESTWNNLAAPVRPSNAPIVTKSPSFTTQPTPAVVAAKTVLLPRILEARVAILFAWFWMTFLTAETAVPKAL